MKKLFRKVFSFTAFLLIFFCIGSLSFAESNTTKEMPQSASVYSEEQDSLSYNIPEKIKKMSVKELQHILDVYVVSSNNGIKVFDIEKAEKRKEPSYVIEYGYIFNEIAYELRDTRGMKNSDIIMRFKLSLPVWGNYCGPGHDGDNFTKPTAGILDECCKEHDECYRDMGYFNKRCDMELIRNINNNLDRMPAWERPIAVAIKKFFEVF